MQNYLNFRSIASPIGKSTFPFLNDNFHSESRDAINTHFLVVDGGLNTVDPKQDLFKRLSAPKVNLLCGVIFDEIR